MKKILVIEDDQQICDVIRIYFENEDVPTCFINDGRSAVDLIEKGLNDYSLVLLDIMLPGADGFTICKKLRKSYDIPVIFITARGREEDILYGYELGCDDVIITALQTFRAVCKMHCADKAFRGENSVRYPCLRKYQA